MRATKEPSSPTNNQRQALMPTHKIALFSSLLHKLETPFAFFLLQPSLFIMLFCSFQKILSHFSILLIILTATSIHQGSDGIVKVTWVKTLFAIAGGELGGGQGGATWGQWGAQRGIKKEETEQGNIWGKTVPGWIHINQIGKCKAGAGKFRWARLLHISCANYCFSFSNRMSLFFLWTIYKTYIFSEQQHSIWKIQQNFEQGKRKEFKVYLKLDPVGSTVRYEMRKLCTGSV